MRRFLSVSARVAWLSSTLGVLSSCEEDRKPPAPAAEPPPAPAEAPRPALPAPAAAELAIDAIGPKVGFGRVSLEYPEGPQKLGEALAAERQHLEGKDATVVVDRRAKPVWVSVYLDALGKLGVRRAVIKTETRKEYPPELAFTPELKASSAPSCSVVAMILEDRGTAVWKLGGGVAGKRPKGMAGPDLTMTGDTIERLAKACKGSDTLFVAAAKPIEWGLIYDLAASTAELGGSRFEQRVLLSEIPVPGHRVKLAR